MRGENGVPEPQPSTKAATWNPNALSLHSRARRRAPVAYEREGSSRGLMPAFTPPCKHPGSASGPSLILPSPCAEGPGGWAQAEEGAAAEAPTLFPLALGPRWTWTWPRLHGWRLGGGGCTLDFSVSFAQKLLPCASHPPASLGLRRSRNLSEKLRRKPQALPPPPSQSMRKGLGGKLGTRVRV